MNIRALASALVNRSWYAQNAGITFAGKRDLFTALGYKTALGVNDYRGRYLRNAVAARIIEAFPKATWRGISGELVEVQDPDVVTAFEEAWFVLSERLKIWQVFKRADILAGLGRYSVILIGAPGNLDTELPKTLKPENIAYLAPFGEHDATISTWDEDPQSERFGLPLTYKLQRTQSGSSQTRTTERTTHWSRVIHVADNVLDENVYGIPRLERVWNLLDDLEKITGGGAEAFWLRAHQGYQINIDKDAKLTADAQEHLEDEVEEFVHGISRVMQTKGVEVNSLGSDVAQFDQNVSAVLDQIASGTEIPQRILMGSERGNLASEQDRASWAERVQDRRNEFAGPLVVRQLADRFIEHGVLPVPAEYEVRWAQVHDLSDADKVGIAVKYAEINQKAGETIVTPDEIRDLALNMAPLDMDDPQVVGKVDPNAEEVTVDDEEDAFPRAAARVKSVRALVVAKRMSCTKKPNFTGSQTLTLAASGH